MDAVANAAVGSLQVDATLAGYWHLLRWARQFGDRRWAVENARGLGCHLAQWFVAKDEIVFDASTSATARVRELSRGGRRKNDVIDAAAAASVAALQGDASLVIPEDTTVAFRFVGRTKSESSTSSSFAGPEVAARTIHDRDVVVVGVGGVHSELDFGGLDPRGW